MLKKIDNLTRFHYISISSKDSSIGIIIALSYIALSLIILLSSVFLFIKKFKPCYKFLTKDFWILSLIGYILMLFVSYLDIEKVTIFRCHLKLLIQFISSTLIYIPVLHKLFSNYPEKSKYTSWVNNHRYIFLILFIIIDLSIIGVGLIVPYTIEDMGIKDDKNFQICKINGKIHYVLITISLLYKFGIILYSLLLMFLEWFFKLTFYDIHLFTAIYLIDTLLIILFVILHNIKIKNYEFYYSIRETIIIIYVISHYFLSYGIRIFYYKSLKNESENEIAKEISDAFRSDTNSEYLKRFSANSEKMNYNSNIYYNRSYKNRSLYNKFLRMHYRDGTLSRSNNSYINKETSAYSQNRNNGINSKLTKDNIPFSRNMFSVNSKIINK
ncbi:hypothetical protein BCR32DRAFT_268342 [Anaeromyces robustus]|uniref:G-protein coupled receptors family 3 profile domain-containing protein n=1 Tax=Anaeromyces robustus TaxID=1754192 RepID=A0A1Y1X6K7_9FUNG|nr:hypothetical protein BCR32DRAFT_268342 [Anaeromyces robustus]|eukprot:ORX81332.1 hypothetical protein BCR32DRAFT_268342 [Anaeromyces robustus]